MSANDPQPSSGAPGGGRSRPAKADWRRKAGSASAVPGAAPAASRKPGGSWQKKPDQAYEDAKRWYRVKVASWCLISTGLVALFIWLLRYSPERTPLLAMAVTEYGSSQDNRTLTAIGPNGWAAEDLDHFQSLDQREEIVQFARVNYATWETKLAAFGDLAEAIRKLKGGPKKTVIVYLSIHGAVNDDGAPCLLLPGGSPHQASQWLPLRDLLVYLFPKDRQESLPGRKLLILDCNRMDVNWRLGLLYNGFADHLEAVLADVNIPGLAILNSTGPCQVGWTSPEQLHGSVFAYFVRQGLSGAADRKEEGGNEDNVVSLQELCRYVKAHVRQWVLAYRADIQEPMLVPKDAEISPLVYAKPSGSTSLPAVETVADARWKDVEGLWKEHQELLARSPYRLHPLGWEEFQQKLLRLEQLVLAGKAYGDEFERVKRRLDLLAGTLTTDALPAQLAAYSLPLAAQLTPSPNIDQQRKALRARWSKTQRRFEIEPGQQYSYQAASQEAWQQCRDGLDGDRWPDLLKFIDAADGQPRADVVELHFLRMLSAHLDPLTWKDHADLVRTALATRELAERAAAPDDERAHYWTQPLVDRADAERRAAEDQLFVGSPEAVQEAARLMEKIRSADGQTGLYPEAVRQAEQVAAAFALRDRAWATIPYLGQWLFDRLNTDAAASADDLQALIDRTHELGDELDRALATTARWSPGLQQAHAAVAEKLDRLMATFRKECAQLWEAAGADRKTLRRIATVLAVPLVTGEERNRLRRKYLEIAQAAGDAEGVRHMVASPAGEAATVHYVERLAGRNRYLPLAILSRTRLEGVDEGLRRGPAAPTKPDVRESSNLRERVKSIAAEGQQIRRLLEVVYADADKWLEETTKALALGEKASLAEKRAGRSKADRLVRAAAPLLEVDYQPWSDPALDPAHQLRRLDLHHLLLWHCRRALDDFWGPVPGREGALPYFQIAAQDDLRSAKELCRGATSLREGKDDLPELLEVRVKAAQPAVQPKSTDLFIDKEDEATRGQVAASSAEHLPPGTAAVYLRDPKEPRPGEQTVPLLAEAKPSGPQQRRLVVPIDGPKRAEIPYWVRNDDPRLAARRLEAVALYRGHVARNPFNAEQTKTGVDITYQPPQYPAPIVTVSGSAVQGCPIMFILDYSGSMTEKIFEWIGDQKRETDEPRYVAARGALLHVLQRLVTPDNRYQVGLLVYGHRVGWEQNAQSGKWELIVPDPQNPDKTAPRPKDSTLVTRSDVERFLPLGTLRQTDVADVTNRLNRLRPRGETPLYLAIRQAVEELNTLPRAEDRLHPPLRHIVAITDGVEETSDDNALPQIPDILSVEKVLGENKDIRLDILGFNLTKESFHGEDKLRRFDELKGLGAQTGGGFYEVRDATSLVRALEKSLALTQYTIFRTKDGKEMTPKHVELNSAAPVEQDKQIRVPYTVKVLDPDQPVETAVELEGGESLELFLSEDHKRLEHRRYDKELRGKYEKVPDPEDPANAARQSYIGAHLPVWEGEGVRFFLSVQNADPAKFSPRPEEAWVEIKPVLPEGSGPAPTYVFYDLSFVPDRPVPVLACLAEKWPLAAKEAEIQLYFKARKTAPAPRDVITVGSFKQQGGNATLGSLPGVTFELETKRGQQGAAYRIVITERHPAGGPLNQVKVELEPRPMRVVHHYNYDVGTVRHTFFYEDTVAATAESLAVCFTPLTRLTDHAVSLPKPFVIDIPRRGGLIDR